MSTAVIGTIFKEIQDLLDLKALITNPTFVGEIGIGGVNVSETELGLLEGGLEGANKPIVITLLAPIVVTL